jgi:hypothetical protein
MMYMFLRVGITLALLHPNINMSVEIYRKYVHPHL